MSPTLEVRRSADRAVSVAAGRVTAHSFSFGVHYDPANVGLGALVAVNDDRVEPGHGYPDHPHRDVEIVTWVVSGELTHRDSTGSATPVAAGQVAVQSAGAGVVHAETVAADAGPTRFVQCWLTPRTAGGSPSYAVRAVDLSGGWATLACGRHAHDDVLRIDAPATAYAARLDAGLVQLLPDAARVHVLVTGGRVELATGREGGETVVLADGDAARLEGCAGARLTGRGEVLVWALESGPSTEGR